MFLMPGYGVSQFGVDYYGGLGLGIAYLGTAFEVRGKIGKTRQSNPQADDGVWQMRLTKRGKVPVQMVFYSPTNPQTSPQQANRAKFKTARQAYVALSDSEKAEYTARAKRRGMFGWGLFIRDYFQNN